MSHPEQDNTVRGPFDARVPLHRIVRFWLPLAATWLMMSIEGPYIAAVVARLPDAAFNLAAYGVAFVFAWTAEAPIMMLLTAANTLVRDRTSFVAMRKFAYALCIGVTVAVALANVPPVFRFLTDTLMALPRDVADMVHVATVILIPWPGAIGYRRFYQGVLVRHGMTRRVAFGTVIRLTAMSASALVVALSTSLAGASIGAISLVSGVVAEAIASRWMARHIVQSLLAQSESPAPLTQRRIAEFYFPLALTSMISMATAPLLTFFMGRSRSALESLAVLPVVQNMVFMFRSGGIAYQEVGVALTGDRGEHDHEIARGALTLGGAASLLLALVAFTPLLDVWMINLSGLSPELAAFATLPVRLLVLLPLLEYWLAFQRSRFIVARQTSFVSAATAIEVGMLGTVLVLCVWYWGLVGVVAGSAALFAGRSASNLFLAVMRRRRLPEYRLEVQG